MIAEEMWKLRGRQRRREEKHDERLDGGGEGREGVKGREGGGETRKGRGGASGEREGGGPGAPHLLHALVVEVFGSGHSCKVIGLGRRLSNEKEKKQGSPLTVNWWRSGRTVSDHK